MASPKNWKKKKVSSKGIMVWEHTEGKGYVAVKEFVSGPGNINTQSKTGRYFAIYKDPERNKQVEIVSPHSQDVNVENKKKVRKAAVEWMRNHPMEQDSGSSSTSYERQY